MKTTHLCLIEYTAYKRIDTIVIFNISLNENKQSIKSNPNLYINIRTKIFFFIYRYFQRGIIQWMVPCKNIHYFIILMFFIRYKWPVTPILNLNLIFDSVKQFILMKCNNSAKQNNLVLLLYSK